MRETRSARPARPSAAPDSTPLPGAALRALHGGARGAAPGGAVPSLLLRVLLLGALLLPAAASAQAGSYYFPERGEWERRAPAQVGMNATRLAEAVRFVQSAENPAPRDLSVAHYLSWGREPMDAPVGPFTQRGDVSGFVIKDGYVVAEWGDTKAVEMTFSVTKSFLSTTVGLIWDRGFIPDLHAPVRDLVRTGDFDSEHNRKITWDHLLRQTSDWEGTLWEKPDWVDRPGQDLTAHFNRERDEPGTVYKYNDVRVNLLAWAALNVYRRPLPDLLRDEIMEPIGASATWRWHGYETSWVELDGKHIQSVSGGGHWGGGMFISAEDLARFGYLTLRQGRWKDRQLVSREWLAMAETPGTVNRGYGFMNFFLNTGGEAIPGAPHSAYTHRGAGNNILYVDRENDLLIVMRWVRGNAINDFIGQVLASMEG
jgi:CubicO group peptidase (beta-lactamase class C family)